MQAAVDLPSLSDLHAEKARIAAQEALRALEDARQRTRPANLLHQAARAVSARVLRELDRIAESLLDAIDGEQDETRVHWQLSDAVHTALQELGRACERVSVSLPEFGQRFRHGAQPRDLLTVSQWADRRRWLVSGTNLPGQWRTDRVPHLREIMDDLSEHSPVEEVVVMKASGVGGTEALYNWIGYVMDHLGNRDLMVVLGSLELRDRSFNPRLAKMFSETPGLQEIVSRASRSAANRQDLVEYGANARIIKAGANSAESLRSDHIPYVILDEVDAFPWDVGGEGDPIVLIANRQRNFTRAKRLLVSTPVKDRESRIHQEYLAGNRSRRHVPCPHCDEWFILERTLLRHRLRLPREGEPEGAPRVVEDAWFVCPHCGSEINEGYKPQILPAGRWISEQPSVRRKHSYQISAAYTMIGLGLSWRQLAQRLVDAEDDDSKLKAVINTDWGEVYRESAEGADEGALLGRCEPYTREQIEQAHPGLVVTAWADVQKDRIEVSFVGWLASEECWLLDHQVLPGETTEPAVWEDLADALADGRVLAAGVDAGYNTSQVLRFCATRKWVSPTKGTPGVQRPLIQSRQVRMRRLARQRRAGPLIEPLGVDEGKETLYNRLRMLKPGPGYIHFPQSQAFDREYFAQLAAEELRTKKIGGRPLRFWFQLRPRNEALDCLVGNLAVFRMAMQAREVPRVARRVKADAAAAVEAAGKPADHPADDAADDPAATAQPAAESSAAVGQAVDQAAAPPAAVPAAQINLQQLLADARRKFGRR